MEKVYPPLPEGCNVNPFRYRQLASHELVRDDDEVYVVKSGNREGDWIPLCFNRGGWCQVTKYRQMWKGCNVGTRIVQRPLTELQSERYKKKLLYKMTQEKVNA
jgi:hypothetical protein